MTPEEAYGAIAGAILCFLALSIIATIDLYENH